MGRIVVFDNPLDPAEKRVFTHDGPFIEFLLKEFPNGFHGSHVTSFNLDKLPVEGYDKVVGPGDLVTLSLLPAYPAVFVPMFTAMGMGATAAGVAAGIASAVAMAVVSAALSYAITAVFGPKASKPGSPADSSPSGANASAAASPTYTLNTPRNSIRLGQPIPVSYGTNLIVPDIASQPYAWNQDNEQYVGMILCLGQGLHEIHSVKVADTLASSISAGVFTYTVFPPSAHNKTFGVIQNATGIYENLYTSPEVSDLELVTEAGYVYEYLPAEQWSGASDGVAAAWFYLSRALPDVATDIANGSSIWTHIKDGPNAGTHRVGFIYHAGNVGDGATAGMFRKGHLGEGTTWAAESSSDMAFVYGDIDWVAGEYASGQYVGPAACVPVDTYTSHIQVDLDMPNGIYTTNGFTGELRELTVSAEFKIFAIDNDGNRTGYEQTETFSESLATRDRQRRTLNFYVPYGRYEVMARRTSYMSARGQDASQLYWTGLKSVLGNTFNSQVYGDVTMIAVKAKASNGLNSDAMTRLSVRCTRILEGASTRNPIAAFQDIFTNTIYGGRRPLSSLDTAKMGQMRAAHSASYFDAVFDTETTVWEAAGYALQMIHASPTMVGSLISIIEDKNYTAPVMALTEETIKSLSIAFLTSDGEEPDGVEGAYRDPDDNAEMFAIYPKDAVDPETVTLYGCRTYDSALAYVRQRWLQLKLRRTLITLETELEGHVVVVGSPINVTHPLLGEEPVLCIVNSVAPKDEFYSTIDLHKHEPGVFS